MIAVPACSSYFFLAAGAAALAAGAAPLAAAGAAPPLAGAAPPLARSRAGLGGVAAGSRRTFRGRCRSRHRSFLFLLHGAGDGGDREVPILDGQHGILGSVTAEMWIERPISRPVRSTSKKAGM